MADVALPAARALSSLRQVELAHTGQWSLGSGLWNASRDDFVAAVAALDCPAVRRPVLKLGHSQGEEPLWAGNPTGAPAVGYVDNLGTTNHGHTLVGDFVGMPGWLGSVAASAYPDRSVEGTYDFRCQIGHTHPFVITAVALLGVTRPGVGTLRSLQDVGRLYGVEAANSSWKDQPRRKDRSLTDHRGRWVDESGSDGSGDVEPAGSRQGGSWERRMSRARKGKEASAAVPINSDAALEAVTTEKEDSGLGYAIEVDRELNGVGGNDVREAVADYGGNGYESVNGALRSVKGRPDRLPANVPGVLHYSPQRAKDIVVGVDAAMAASKLTDDIVVYRGVGNPKRTFGAAWNGDGDMTGLEWQDYAFVSTSNRENTARQFAGNGAGVRMNILVPAGVGAIGIEQAADSRLASESEVLLDRGLRMRVVRDRGDVDGVRTLDVEVAPDA